MCTVKKVIVKNDLALVYTQSEIYFRINIQYACILVLAKMYTVVCFRLYTLYSKSLPLDVACRVWDVYLRDGEEFLVKTALGEYIFNCYIVVLYWT